jgi:hypothetical protein
MTHHRLVILLLVPLLAAGCERSEPTGVDPTGLQAADPALEASRATVDLEEFPVTLPPNFRPFVACLGSQVTVSGTLIFRDRTVTFPDGYQHLTRKMDASNTMITLGDRVWTANPNASEILIQSLAPDGTVLHEEHLGAVIFRDGDNRPALQLFHQTSLVFLPGDPAEPHLDHNVFTIRCIGPAS